MKARLVGRGDGKKYIERAGGTKCYSQSIGSESDEHDSHALRPQYTFHLSFPFYASYLAGSSYLGQSNITKLCLNKWFLTKTTLSSFRFR